MRTLLLAPLAVHSFNDQLHKISKFLKMHDHDVSIKDVQPRPSIKGSFDNLILLCTLVGGKSTQLFKEQSSCALRSLFYGIVEGRIFVSQEDLAIVADSVIAPSEFCEEELQKVGIRIKGIVKHGIDVDEVQRTEKIQHVMKKRLAAKGRTMFYYCGDNLSRKGVIALLRAFQIVSKKRKDFLAVLHTNYGLHGIDYRPIMQELTKGLTNVLVQDEFGRTSRSHVFDEMSAADVYIHPSKAEAFGLPIPEAMGAGKPVISIDAKPMNEINTTKTGILVPYDSVEYYTEEPEFSKEILFRLHNFKPEHMSEAIEYALDHGREMQEKGIRAEEEARKKFDFRITYQELLRHLTE